MALIGLSSHPESAAAGYDIAHIVERTCEPGGPLIVGDEWKGSRLDDEVVREPGEVIGCPAVGVEAKFQIAAGPERIGRDRFHCVYFSLMNGDGADICLSPGPKRGGSSFLEPLMTVRTDDAIAPPRDPVNPLAGERVAVAGIVGVDAVGVEPIYAGDVAPRPLLVPVGFHRAEHLGASRSFAYFSINVPGRTLCSNRGVRLIARDPSGKTLATSRIAPSTSVLDPTDGATYSRPLRSVCEIAGESEPRSSSWLVQLLTAARSALLRAFSGPIGVQPSGPGNESDVGSE